MSSYLGSVGSNGDRVTRAIAASARRTGVDFNYLMGQAKVESGMNPDAKASTSSATGLYQFIDQSWLGVVDKHGSKHGLDWAANAIQRDSKGRLRVADPETRHAILALRKNPEVAALMAGEFAADNRQYLEGSLGRQAAPVDLYLAHFLGPEGARQFLASHDANPDAAAAPMFGRAAQANRNIFYDRGGSPRSFAEIRNRFADKLGGAANAGGSRLPRQGNDLPQVQPADYLRLANARAARPDTAAPLGGNENARLAYMLLAAMGA
ncbi:transglycosylase SLT domain-containing protein [Blastomonas sp.]|uniref:transglycosylase SLT domain-containing protein n=1 Tax=Blastomonas sp. TaxID=1909299 RepID=UPI002618592E|nr:transglycosylase SLT domain-containing protein [Blastomonas sp.]MDM7955992.1 transglycosylase SLT domain-containing protein [Blastomonas sp.]